MEEHKLIGMLVILYRSHRMKSALVRIQFRQPMELRKYLNRMHVNLWVERLSCHPHAPSPPPSAIEPRMCQFSVTKFITSTRITHVEMADKDYDSDDSEQVVEKEEETPEVLEDVTLTNPDVVTKYQEAAKIAQAVLIDVSARVRASLTILFFL